MAKAKKTKRNTILTSPYLLPILIEEVQRSVAGEESTIETILTHAFGRLVLNAKPTSFNLALHAQSGVGKDHVVLGCLDLFPDGVLDENKSLSPKAVRYLHTAYRVAGTEKWKGEPDWTWDGKIFYAEDISNAVINDEVFKVMLSSRLSTERVVEKQRTLDIRITGKAVVIVTTASVNLHNENIRRFMVCGLDESREQTRAILNKHDEWEKMRPEDRVPSADVRGELAKLKRVSVSVPFSTEISPHFSDAHPIIRTAYPRFLDLIRASAALHQYQRKRIAKDTIEANWSDYDAACRILYYTTTNDLMVPVTGSKKKLLATMTESTGKQGNWFDAKMLLERTGLEYRNLMHHLSGMVEIGLLETESETDALTGKYHQVWRPMRRVAFDLPSSEEISS